MESPDGIKLFFLGRKERPEEAPFIPLEKKVYEGGLVMDSWIRPK
ncbi:hypothetical protein SLW70_13635 [Flavobacterium sp. NG2]|nr:hypothetical protein [Flavobacterium sp. NG2]WPR70964.1 hypothetical protein SLW70_13635 [Flavobacterium sp. NG2]